MPFPFKQVAVATIWNRARKAQLCSLWPQRNEEDPHGPRLWLEEEAEARTSGQDKLVQSQAWE